MSDRTATRLLAGGLLLAALVIGAIACAGLVKFVVTIRAGGDRLVLEPRDAQGLFLALGVALTAVCVAIPGPPEGHDRRRQASMVGRIATIWLSATVLCVVLAFVAPTIVAHSAANAARDAAYLPCAPPDDERRAPLRWISSAPRSNAAHCPATVRESKVFDIKA